ncbi:Sodium-dependent serotonin transporter [Eumeta japonica]|uniref:Sodium-dependent serotonin transporter n=1 Tax=Eumeta variegata TaxID=151549 RepID=A0A4C1TRU4_EUMVA|nr:Sodium-dependent serotonin transporter [Eumeta japonica]
MITALCDEYPRSIGRRRELFVLLLLAGIYLCSANNDLWRCFLSKLPKCLRAGLGNTICGIRGGGWSFGSMASIAFLPTSNKCWAKNLDSFGVYAGPI